MSNVPHFNTGRGNLSEAVPLIIANGAGQKLFWKWITTDACVGCTAARFGEEAVARYALFKRDLQLLNLRGWPWQRRLVGSNCAMSLKFASIDMGARQVETCEYLPD